MSGRGVDDILAELLGDDAEESSSAAEPTPAVAVPPPAAGVTPAAAASARGPAPSQPTTGGIDSAYTQQQLSAASNEEASSGEAHSSDSNEADALLIELGVADAPPAAGAAPSLQAAAATSGTPSASAEAVLANGTNSTNGVRQQRPSSSRLDHDTGTHGDVPSSPAAAAAVVPGGLTPTAAAGTEDSLAAAVLPLPQVATGPVKHASSDLEPVLTAAMEAVTAAITTTTASCSGEDGAARYDPLTALTEQLAGAAADWNPRGRPDSSGSMVGGAVLMKLEPLASTGPADMAGYINPHGRPQVIAAAGQYVALGMPNSVTIIVQLPTAHAQHSGGGGAAAAGGGSGAAAATSGGSATGSVHVCGEVKHGTEAVTALAFSTVTSAGDGLWLAVGHLSGAVAVWDLQRRGPRLVTTIPGQGVPITVISFLPARSTSCLLTADTRGRMQLHTVSSLLLRTSVSSKLLLDGQYGPILGVQHLTPFILEVPTAAAAAAAAGGGGGGSAAGAAGAATATAAAVSPKAAGDSKAVAFHEGPWRVGEGVMLLVTPSHCYIARLKPSGGELLLLYSIPQPSPAQLAAGLQAGAGGASGEAPLPVAAWLPHYRKQAAATKSHGDLLVPVAQLALAWGPRLVLFDVPLIGDQLNTSEAAVAAAAAAAAEAAAPLVGPAGIRLPTAGRMSGGSGTTHSSALMDAMTPAIASQLTGLFGLKLAHMWCGSRPKQAAKAAAGGSGGSDVGPVEPMPILGLHWLDHDALSLVTQQGLSSLLLVLDGSLHVKEQVEWMDMPLGPPVTLPAVSPGYACSVVGLGARLYLLGSQGAVCGRLLSWSERLKTLQDVSKWRLGLSVALRFYKTLTSSSRPGSKQPVDGEPTAAAAPNKRPGGVAKGPPTGLARCEGSSAELPQIEQWMLSLMLGYLQYVAGSPGSGSPEQQQQQELEQACATSVACCLLLQRSQVLFDRVFALFSRSAHLGAVGCFVAALEPAVLADLLPGLPPEVMQALVEHFAGAGELQRVERCVLRMSITSLDLNQVLRLCEAHHLYAALTYIYCQIRDFKRPVIDLLAAVAAAEDLAKAQRYGYLLLVYLQGAFQGQGFPPGSGSVVDAHTTLDSIKATLLGLLLFLDRQDLLQEWSRAGLQGNAAIAAATGAAAAAEGGAPAASCAPKARHLQDPHPALRLLLAVDVAATIQVLAQATEGWDAVETDLRAAAGKPAEELESVMVATQVVVNALVSLLESGSLLHLQQSSSSSSSSSDGVGGGSKAAHLHVVREYVLSLACSGRVRVKPSFVLLLLKQLVEDAAAAAAEAAAAPPSSNAHRAAAAARAHAEERFVQLIEETGINLAGQPLDRDKLGAQEAAQAQELAAAAGFLSASAAIHHQLGNFSAALKCHLQRHAAAPRAVFDYAHRHLSLRLTSAQRLQFTSSIMQHAAALVAADPQAAAALVSQHMATEQISMLKQLESQPQQQFNLLNAIMQLESAARHAFSDDSGHMDGLPAVAAAGNMPGGSSSDAAGAGGGGASKRQGLLDRPEVVDMYIQLLTRFQPGAVLRFLQGHEGYNVQAAVKLCQAAGVADAEAYLHERLGNYEAALRLHLARAAAANAALEAALLSGQVSLVELPAWAAGLSWGVPHSSGHSPKPRGPTSSSSSTVGNHRLGSELASAAAAGLHALQELPYGLGGLADALWRIVARQTGSCTEPGTAQHIDSSDSPAADANSQQEQWQLVVRTLAIWLHQQLAPATSSGKHPAHAARGATQAGGRADGHQQQQVSGGVPAASSFSKGAPLPSHGTPRHRQVLQTASFGRPEAGTPTSASPAASAASFLIVQLMAGVRLRHQGWLVALSPRTQLGHSSSSGSGHGQASATGPAAQADGTAGSGGVLELAPPPAGPLQPQEQLLGVWRHLQEVLSCCCRISRAAAKTQEVQEAQRCWFTLMETYVQRLRVQQNGSSSSSSRAKAGSSSSKGADAGGSQQQQQLVRLEQAAAGLCSVEEVEQLLQSAGAGVAQLALRDCYAFLLDDVISRMADHVPLLDIVTWVLSQHGGERFGDFRSTLLGLFGAYAYEFNIMRAANRLITKDAWHQMWQRYSGLSGAAQEVVVEEGPAGKQEDAVDARQLQEALPLVAQRAAATMGKLLSAADVVQGALQVGVLRTGGSGNTGASSSNTGQHWLLQPLHDMLAAAAPGEGAAAGQDEAAAPQRSMYGAVAVASRISKVGHHAVLRAAVDLASVRGQQMLRVSAGTAVARGGHEAASGGLGPAAAAGQPSGPAGADFDIDELLDWTSTAQL